MKHLKKTAVIMSIMILLLSSIPSASYAKPFIGHEDKTSSTMNDAGCIVTVTLRYHYFFWIQIDVEPVNMQVDCSGAQTLVQ